MTAVAIPALAAQEVAAALPEREYRRLLQWPRGRDLPAELRDRAQAARRWYARHGRPYLAMRRIGLRAIEGKRVTLDTGLVLTDATLAAVLRDAGAHALAIVVASAGREVAGESAIRWAAGWPDEAYFLDRLAAGVAEDLLARATTGLCRELAPRHEQLLPHQSPGCGDWDLADQHRLMQVLGADRGPVTLLASGALEPQHSVLAAFGIAGRPAAATRPASACRRCDLDPCAFRRRPFQGPAHPL